MAGHNFGSDGKCHCGESKESYDRSHADDWKNETYADNSDSRSSSCFPHTALIDTPQGKVKIGDLTVGQMVWSFQGGNRVKSVITKKLVHDNAKISAIEFGNNETQVRCTVNHSFLTNRGYLALSKIVVGDSIVHVDAGGVKSLQRVTGITDTKTWEPVFNLYTQGEHNFIVDGYVAHNFTRFRAIRTIFHRLFLDGHIEAVGQVALQR